MKILQAAVAAVVMTASMLSAASATVLTPGNTVPTTGTTSATDPRLAGPVQNDNLLPFIINRTSPFFGVGGNIQNRVTLSDSEGTLIFAPRIRDVFNIDISPFRITSVELIGFGSFATDVDFRTDGQGDKGFSSVDRSADGNSLTFHYDNTIYIGNLLGQAQEESLFPSILTDATHFQNIGIMIISGFWTDEPGNIVQTRIEGIAVPTNAVPIPGAALLLAPILAAGGFARARKKRTV